MERTLTSIPTTSPIWRAMTGPAAWRTAARMRRQSGGSTVSSASGVRYGISITA
ncbi:hypothetical protein [Streptomyces sp. NPDC090994]|uniref:hypothetical protein n=1 Tax=Streptomyces sp. NPDC090994 TaxID=3365969 RepID=UPI00382652AE